MLRKNELIISDSNYKQFINPTVNGNRMGSGYIPRDMKAVPYGSMPEAPAFDMDIIDPSDWDGIYEERVAKKQLLSDLRLTGNYGQIVPSLDQGGQGYCWAYSTTAGVMLTRTFNNQPYVRLSAHAIGCLVKGYRDEGGWCGLSLKHHVEHGCPSVEYWKEKSMARSNDTPDMRSNAAMHKVTEGFYDLGAQVWDYKLTFNQIATCLLLGIPCAGDFMWWGHSVCILDLVRISAGNWGLRILNSWTDNWGDRGMAVLEGSKARPEGALAIRVTGASPA